jgi:regulator of RNase E activity RraA
MRTGKDRVEVAEVGGIVTVGGAQIVHGDLVVGDDDGVIVLPRAIETEVIEVASWIARRESVILADALAGTTVAQARARHGYHELQRREQ